MKTFTLLALTLWGFSAMASIKCQTPNQHKIIELKANKVVILKGDDLERRELASFEFVKTKSKGNGFTKYMNFENQKHIIHVEDQQKFSDVNDYLIIKDNAGHEMTYPLSCEQA